MRWDKNSVREGMFVTSTKGERIGKVIRRDEGTFIVEKGTFFPKNYELRYDHITAIEDGGITYSLADLATRSDRLPSATAVDTRAGAAPLASSTAAPSSGSSGKLPAPARSTTASASPPEAPSAPRAVAAPAPAAASAHDPSDGEHEVRIPLMQEEVEIEKVPRESGHVRIHKGVKTEERHFTVPVQREEIVIEHVTAFAGGAGTGEEGTFEDRVLDIALHEEEIRVTKRPVLREEIVVRTVAHSVEKETTATLRHEEADVEDTRKAGGSSEARERDRSDEGYGAPGRR